MLLSLDLALEKFSPRKHVKIERTGSTTHRWATFSSAQVVSDLTTANTSRIDHAQQND
jgi:hypothetical protein